MVGEQYRLLVVLCDGGEQLGICCIAAWGDQRAGEIYVRLLGGGDSVVAWVGEVGAYGQGDAGPVHVDQAAFMAGGTINLLPFVKVLF